MADKSLIREKLEKRHKDRLEKFEKQRQARVKEKKDSPENVDIFLESFNKEKREIIMTLNQLEPNETRVNLTSEFDKITQQMQTLQKFLSDSASFLPSYDIRRAQEILKQTREDINEKRELLLPKKKFAFKSRQKLKATTASDSMEKASEKISEKVDKINLMESTLGFTDRSGEVLVISYEESKGKSINLSNLEDCTIEIYGCPSAIRIKNVINTAIYSGPVNRSIFVNDCIDCEFHFACQQLRIHATVSTKFFIHVTSKAIIEDCEDVGFSSYVWQYEQLREHFIESGLNPNVNNWADIDDFNWLKLDEHSPNWYTI